MLNTDFAPWPSYTPREVDAVRRVLMSNRVNQWTGREVVRFETEFARWSGAAHAVAVGNGTLALELALRGVGVEPGDEVIVPSRSFFASASCIVALGAVPVFADVDARTQALSAQTVEPRLTERTRAIVVVHLGGQCADLAPLVSLARRRGLAVVEDCAQAHGARYRGRSVGTIGTVGAWSFCQDKIMSTGGEGGMVTTDSETIWRRMWSYKDHGKSYEAVFEHRHPPGFRWLHDAFGSNYRMTEMQAAIGRIQLDYMDRWTLARTTNARRLRAVAAAFDAFEAPEPLPCTEEAGYRAYLFVRPENMPRTWSRDRVIEELQELGVPAFTGSCSEIYRERAFDGTGWRPKRPLPVAADLGNRAIALLVHPTLEEHEIALACEAIERIGSSIARERRGRSQRVPRPAPAGFSAV